MATKIKRTGGGLFDPSEPPIYFVAGTTPNRKEAGATVCEHTLMALNDLINSPTEATEFDERVTAGHKVLLDSGVFWLTNRHARANGVSMDEALTLHPNEIDGFDDLWTAYVATVKKYEAGLWGYIELDQGGAERKRETRARIEAEGLVPIPVYHPTVDGWDYFDELATQYDRICLGNIVQASNDERRRILATVWERHRAYPHLWIHVLGMTPSETIGTYYFNSCDSSSLVGMLRFGAGSSPIGMSALRKMGAADASYSYDPLRDKHYGRAAALVYSAGHFITHTWRAQHAASLGVALPPVEAWEPPLR